MPDKIKSKVARTKVSPEVLFTLWGIAAGRCEICNKILFKEDTFGVSGNFSQVAHIHAVSPNGPRNVKNMSTDEINDIRNLMLLCYDHHHMIDAKPEDFMGEELITFKHNHEERVFAQTDISDLQKCSMISYFSNLDNKKITFGEELFRRAVIKAGFLPGTAKCIDLSDSEPDGYTPNKEYFIQKESSLVKRFRRYFSDIIEAKENIAVFALASQPLLIKLGQLINDKYAAYPFQCHRTGEKWVWKNSHEKIEFQTVFPQIIAGDKCALVVDLSAKIIDSRIEEICGNIPIIHLTIASPCRTFVTHKEILDDFTKKFREIMERIKNTSSCKKILLFPAMPNSLAIKLGMDLMPKTDLPITIFEQGEPDKPFFETITIGDNHAEP